MSSASYSSLGLSISSNCFGCIDSKRGVIVSLVFLLAGWAAWSLGRLLNTAIITFQYVAVTPSEPVVVFPTSAYTAAISVSIANIVLAIALGWHILSCSVEGCFTVFLPLFASVAPLANWALYRVGLNVFSYVGLLSLLSVPLIQFVTAIGLLSIPALILTFFIADGRGDVFVTAVASAIPLLYAIARYALVATAGNLIPPTVADPTVAIRRGIFHAIALASALAFFLRCRAKCPIPRIFYGLAAGIFGWAVIYLYSTYSSNYLDAEFATRVADLATLNIGLTIIFTAAIIALFLVKAVRCDELIGSLVLTNFALLIVGIAGFIGTLAYYSAQLITAADKQVAGIIFGIYISIAIILPRFFGKCRGRERRTVIAIASLGFGIAAVELGRAIVYARAVAFTTIALSKLDFSTVIYIFAAIVAVLAGQAIVWAYPQANAYTAQIAAAIGLVAGGTAFQVTPFVISAANDDIVGNTGPCWSALVVLYACHRWLALVRGDQVLVHPATLSASWWDC